MEAEKGAGGGGGGGGGGNSTADDSNDTDGGGCRLDSCTDEDTGSMDRESDNSEAYK